MTNLAAVEQAALLTPRLKRVKNVTPFSFFQCMKMAVGRIFHDVVVIKGAFELSDGALRALGPASIALADKPWDSSAPERSSLELAGDMHLAKPSTDVIVTGTARPDQGRSLREWDVGVVVGDHAREPILSHALRVTGPRSWEHRGLRGWTLSDPEPTDGVPLRYERAYGGAYFDPGTEEWVTCEANPSGVGLFATLDKRQRYTAPQWALEEHPPTEPNREVPLAGLGPVSRIWSSRLRHAGTYDDAWERRARQDAELRLPADYAPDFDARFFQCAHPKLIAPGYLRGDEHIGLRGLMGGEGDLLTRLPGIAVHASLSSISGSWTDCAVPLDTVHIDLDKRRAYLSWRLCLDHAREVSAAVLYMEETRSP